MATGETIYAGLIDRGLPPLQAAILTGNIEAESGFNPTAWNPKEGAGGLLQWRLDRLTNLQKHAAEAGKDISDPDLQLDYLVSELNGPAEGPNAAAFLAATDPESANLGLKSFIRYAPGTEGQRLKYAMNYVQSGNGSDAPDAEFEQLFSGTSGADVDAEFEQLFAPKKAPEPGASSSDAEFEDLFGSSPPPGAKPGSKEYAIWARDQALAGRKLPQVSDTPPPPEFTGPNQDLGSKLFTWGGSHLEGTPVIGPTLIDWAKKGRAALHGMTEEEVAKEFAEAKAANPTTAAIGGASGAVLPMLALSTVPGVDKLLGAAGSLGSRILLGTASGGAITGADTLARGGSGADAVNNALIGGGIAGAFPIVGAGLRAGGNALGATWQAFKGPSAPQVLKNALAADDIAPAQVNALLRDAGPGAVLADLGPNLQQLAGGIASVPGAGQAVIKRAIAGREAQAGNRLIGAVDEALGTGRPVGEVAAEITAAQKAAADPLYKAVRDVQIPISGDLAAVIRTPMGEKAFREAAVTLANDGITVNGLTVGLVDAAKQSLDDIASSAARLGNNNQARQAADMAKRLREAADAVEPRYAQAREAFAGPAAVKDALDAGRDVFTRKTSAAELKTMLSDMTASEKDALLTGVQDAVREAISNARNDVAGVKALFSSGAAKEKLGLLLGDDAVEEIEKALARQSSQASTNVEIAKQSVSAARLAGQKAAAPELSPLPSNQTVMGAILSAIGKARLALTATYRGDQNRKLANMLMAGQLAAKSVGRIAPPSGPRNALLAPATVPVVAEQNELLPRIPIDITVRGGNPLLAQ